MIVDGRSIAADILAATKEEVAMLPHVPVVRAVVVVPSVATESYLRVKSARAEEAGMKMDIVRLPDNATN
jgi:5,10-methylene-tetrahydrofolate dehydrogenase/methenyl tetrahydrofolate cyclohydrolase